MSWSFFGNFRHALRGLKIALKTEKIFRLHLVIAALVLLVAWYRQLSDTVWIGLLLLIAFILALEIFNSAIERLVDILAPKTHNFAAEVKDLLAGMVLLASLVALAVGLIILL